MLSLVLLLNLHFRFYGVEHIGKLLHTNGGSDALQIAFNIVYCYNILALFLDIIQLIDGVVVVECYAQGFMLYLLHLNFKTRNIIGENFHLHLHILQIFDYCV